MATKERILIYGATGYMGRLLTQAAKYADLPVVLAGRNREKLQELAAKYDLPFRVIPLETPSERDARLETARRSALFSEQDFGPKAAKSRAAVNDRHEALDSALANVRRVLKGVDSFPPEAIPHVERSEQRLAQARTFVRGRQDDSRNAALDRTLTDIKVVLNAAGPFAETATALARACLRTRTDYTDIGGEFDVINELNDLGEDARKVGAVLMPGVGLTVMASDVLVRCAVEEGRKRGMAAPHVVRVALSRVPFVSRGSAKTMLASVREGVRVIRNGDYVYVPVGSLVRAFKFDPTEEPGLSFTRLCTAVTLADLLTVGATAQQAWDRAAWEVQPAVTPNVETYVEASSLERFAYELGAEFALALRSQPVKGLLDKALSLWPEGPDEDERNESGQLVAVEVEDRYRRSVEMRLTTRNSYDFTVQAALTVVECLRYRPESWRGFLSPAWAAQNVGTLLPALGTIDMVQRGFER
jgi:saccharopine dehydrogenase (NAD+, L-lysine-forming)